MRTTDELVEFIRERSHEVGTSLTKIEKEVGLSNGRIGKWKTQKRYPSHDTLVAIAALLKISVEELTGEEQKEKHSTDNGRVLTPENYKIAYKDMTTAELYSMLSEITKELQGRGSNET